MNPLSKEEFLEKLKTDREFNNRYGRKHITEGKMVLPPCHYGFQVYTRELSLDERRNLVTPEKYESVYNGGDSRNTLSHSEIDQWGYPTRAISLMWNQRSVDTFLGLPFNIASYGLLLEIIAKAVNMVPDELIGNLGDVHLYSNHIEQAKEQIGREMTTEEKTDWLNKNYPLYGLGEWTVEKLSDKDYLKEVEVEYNTPTRTREPFPLPTLKMNPIFLANLEHKEFDDAINGQINFELENYQSHPTIKAPLSN